MMMKLAVIAILLWATAVSAQPHMWRADPVTRLPNETVVAVIDGTPITVGELEEFSQSKDPRKLHQLNQQLFDFREAMLGLMLGERLLKIEAERAGKPVEEHLASVLQVEPVTEAEIDAVLDQQPAPPGMEPTQVRPTVRKVLEARKQQEARKRYLDGLIMKAKKAPKPLAIYLQPPRLNVPIDETDPVRGSGPVELVEFSDFECPYCQKFQPVLREVLAQFEGKVKHVWKDLPLPMHQNAVAAAMAARCAQDQNRFWEYHDVLFANQQALTRADLKKHADVVGLDVQSFNACLDGGKYRKQLNGARQAASNVYVLTTPTLFINGRLITGLAPKEEYARVISAELEAAAN